MARRTTGWILQGTLHVAENWKAAETNEGSRTRKCLEMRFNSDGPMGDCEVDTMVLAAADRIEMCLKCGNYTLAHEGACNGCRWREMHHET